MRGGNGGEWDRTPQKKLTPFQVGSRHLEKKNGNFFHRWTDSTKKGGSRRPVIKSGRLPQPTNKANADHES